ncbi:unnamed protein product [Effrenium voratum]|nr:unnamed protein product [Effrenium voratum]
MTFLEDCEIDYTEEMIRASFSVVKNKLADSKCGCGSSFSPLSAEWRWFGARPCHQSGVQLQLKTQDGQGFPSNFVGMKFALLLIAGVSAVELSKAGWALELLGFRGWAAGDEIGVEGFPTIKYGDPANLEDGRGLRPSWLFLGFSGGCRGCGHEPFDREDYEGGREFADLDKFTKANLGPRCGPGSLDLCDADKKKLIESFLSMPGASLNKEIESKDEEIKAATKKHEEFVESLQKQYEESDKAMQAKKQEIKESGLGLMKAVKSYRKSVKKEEL